MYKRRGHYSSSFCWGNYTHGGFRQEDVGVRNQLSPLLISFLFNSHQGPELNWVLANFLLFNVCLDSVFCRVLPRTELEIGFECKLFTVEVVPENTERRVGSETGKESCIIKTAATIGNWNLMLPGNLMETCVENTSQLFPWGRRKLRYLYTNTVSCWLRLLLEEWANCWYFCSTTSVANWSPEAREILRQVNAGAPGFDVRIIHPSGDKGLALTVAGTDATRLPTPLPYQRELYMLL